MTHDSDARHEPQSNGAGPSSGPSQRDYLRFFWPLAATGMLGLLARQFQNGALARTDDPKVQLATYGLALTIFKLFQNPSLFMQALSNVLARSPENLRRCFRFALVVSMLGALPVAILAFTGLGEAFLRGAYNVETALLPGVTLYLKLLLPMCIVESHAQLYLGLLMQARRTGMTMALRAVRIGVLAAVLVAGLAGGGDPIVVVALAEIASALAQLAGGWLLARRYHAFPEGEDPPLTYGAIWRFFWPVAITAMMMPFSRTIIYSFVNRIDNPTAVLAALAVAFPLSQMIYNPLNQLRNLAITFGINTGTRASMRRFFAKVTATDLVVLGLCFWTPLHAPILSGLMGVHGEVLRMAHHAILVMCLMPVVIALRSWWQGMAMDRRQTIGMGLGGILRNLAIYLATLALFHLGWLNHVGAAAMLITGFAVETLVVGATTSGKWRVDSG